MRYYSEYMLCDWIIETVDGESALTLLVGLLITAMRCSALLRHCNLLLDPVSSGGGFPA